MKRPRNRPAITTSVLRDPLKVDPPEATRGGGGRDADADRTVDELCRGLTLPAVRALERVIKDPNTRPMAIVSAAGLIFDRGWGRSRAAEEKEHSRGVSEMTNAELAATIRSEVAKATAKGEKVDLPAGIAALLTKEQGKG